MTACGAGGECVGAKEVLREWRVSFRHGVLLLCSVCSPGDGLGCLGIRKVGKGPDNDIPCFQCIQEQLSGGLLAHDG